MKISFRKINFTRFLSLEGFQKSSIYLVSFAVFILFNILAFYLLPFRFDFSLGQAHTLSPATKKIIKKLDDIVNIKLFISSDLPIRLSGLKTEVTDLIKEYQKETRGKIIVKILDPKKDESALNEAKELGIPELQFSQIEKDKYAVATTYFGIAVQYGDKREIVPQATNLVSLEYDITSIIYKLTRKEPLRLGVMGIEETVANPQEDEFASIKKILKQQFDLEFLKNGEDPSSSIKTILALDDNKNSYTTNEAKMLERFLRMNKGKVVFIVDGVSIAEGLTTKEANHNLFPLFQTFGINLNKNLVLSYSSQMASFTTGMVSFFTPYPFWLKTRNFSAGISELTNVGALIFPWTSSIEIEKNKETKTKVLVKSEEKSWEQKDSFVLAPNNIPEPSPQDLKEFNLIVETEIKNGGRLTLIPSSRFVKEQFISQDSGNIAFLINQINNYASEGALSGIRNRVLISLPLKNISEGAKDMVKYLNIFLLPGITAFLAAIKLLRRK